MNAAREAEIARLLPLVRRMARRIERLVPGSDLSDLIGDGAVGLIRAVDSFDPAIGPPLEIYARRVILGAMLNGIRRLDPVSERVRRIVRLAERDRFAMAVESGAMPTAAQLETRHPLLRRAQAEAHQGSPLSLDGPLPPGSRIPLDQTVDPEQVTLARAERERIRAAVAALPARQRAVMVEHYFHDRPLRALGVDMAVSSQRVSQLHLAALARMRRALAGV